MNQINILWSFSSIETSISEIFAIKNCYFLALIFVQRSEKLSEKTACDVNVGQVKKAGNSKQSFSSRLGAEVDCAAITWKEQAICLQKLQAVVITFLLFNFLEECIIVKRTLTTFTDWGHLKDHRRHFKLAKRCDKQKTIPSCIKFSLRAKDQLQASQRSHAGSCRSPLLHCEWNENLRTER